MTVIQLTRASTAAELTIATPEGVLFRLPLAVLVPGFTQCCSIPLSCWARLTEWGC